MHCCALHHLWLRGWTEGEGSLAFKLRLNVGNCWQKNTEINYQKRQVMNYHLYKQNAFIVIPYRIFDSIINCLCIEGLFAFQNLKVVILTWQRNKHFLYVSNILYYFSVRENHYLFDFYSYTTISST